jgi:SNF2 family DNA or RNA helicase
VGRSLPIADNSLLVACCLLPVAYLAFMAAGLLSEIPWDAVIVDEAHRLKNNTSKTFTSLQSFKAIPPVADRLVEPAHCILMTGTPLQPKPEPLNPKP